MIRRANGKAAALKTMELNNYSNGERVDTIPIQDSKLEQYRGICKISGQSDVNCRKKLSITATLTHPTVRFLKISVETSAQVST